MNEPEQEPSLKDRSTQIRILRAVLLINAGFFLVEIITGLVSGSMGLVADSLDMLADAVVYGLGIWAAGNSLSRKKRVATISGYAQLVLANSVCLYLLQRLKSEEAHMKASMIFTSNDVIINAGVIAAGILVYATGSKYPDLVVGAAVFLIVVRGAFKILKLGN